MEEIEYWTENVDKGDDDEESALVLVKPTVAAVVFVSMGWIDVFTLSVG